MTSSLPKKTRGHMSLAHAHHSTSKYALIWDVLCQCMRGKSIWASGHGTRIPKSSSPKLFLESLVSWPTVKNCTKCMRKHNKYLSVHPSIRPSTQKYFNIHRVCGKARRGSKAAELGEIPSTAQHILDPPPPAPIPGDPGLPPYNTVALAHWIYHSVYHFIIIHI